MSEDKTEDTNENDLYAIPFKGAEDVEVISSTSAKIKYSSPQEGEVTQVNTYCNTSSDSNWVLMNSTSDLLIEELLLEGLVANTSYTCKVNLVVNGREDNNLSHIEFVALGKANRLSFATEPGNGQAGDALIQQPVVHVLDENDNVVAGGPDSAALITLAVAVESPTSGAISGTFAINAVRGVANFEGLFLQEAGVKIMSATKEDTSSLSFGTPSMSVNSAEFTVTNGAVSPDLSTMTVSPTGPLIANGVEVYTVEFELRDVFGNPVQGVAPQFSSNKLGDFLAQPVAATDVDGKVSGSISTTIADTNTNSPRVLSISSP